MGNRQARGSCWESLALFQELGNHHREAAVRDNLGYVEHHLGNLTEAATYYQRSLAMFRETASRLPQAAVLDHLGDNYRAAGEPGEPGEARKAWQQAVDIFDDWITARTPKTSGPSSAQR
jgi:tetratricopeptide (TPR) repeat protein